MVFFKNTWICRINCVLDRVYNDDYSKASGSLWQCYKDDQNDNLTDFKSFKSRIKITGTNPAVQKMLK